MFKPAPVSLLQTVITGIVLLLFIGAVFSKRMGMPKTRDVPSARSHWSIAGVLIQSVAFGIAAVGPIRLEMPSTALSSLAISAAVLGSGLTGAILFARSAHALGANWSIVARTRAEHGLVRDGPFAHLRHPIYFAMLLMLIALAVGFGHAAQLLGAAPLFVVGTMIRIREEERLLRQKFGEDYVSYARDTPAFFPRLRQRS
jgi:protein-S-isoprenylcysteine O-methyltransferase Ste14